MVSHSSLFPCYIGLYIHDLCHMTWSISHKNQCRVFPHPIDIWLGHMTCFGQQNVKENNAAEALNVLA